MSLPPRWDCVQLASVCVCIFRHATCAVLANVVLASFLCGASQPTAWSGVLPNGVHALDPNMKSGQLLSTPPVTLPAASAASAAQRLVALIADDGTVSINALNDLLGASIRVEVLQVRARDMVPAPLCFFRKPPWRVSGVCVADPAAL
jgi:hypothetical protein